MTRLRYRGRHRRRSRAAVLSVTLLALLATSLVVSVAAASAQGRVRPADLSATATPNTGLVDYQIVNVAWSGYPAGSPVWFFTCTSSATSVSEGCATAPSDPLESTTGADGTGVVRYQVRATSFGTFQCDDTHACYVAVLQNNTDLGSGAHASITFAKPPAKCPGSKGPIVLGEGESASAFQMYQWENSACKLSSRPNVSYTADNSYDGIAHFVNGLDQFAGSGVPPSSDDQSQLASQHRTYVTTPITSSALVLAFNIIDQSGHQVTSLNLTPQIVAEIANGSLSTFYCPPSWSDSRCRTNGGDPDIRKLNPGIVFPAGTINFYARAEQSAETLEFTTWLSDTDPTDWPTGPTNVWPEGVCQTCGIQGAGPEALAVGFPATYVRTQIYIGVMDSTWANLANLPEASITNDPGGTSPPPVAPNADSVAAAIGDATKNDDGTLTFDYTTTDPNAYPLPVVGYGILPTSVSTGKAKFSAEDGSTLKDFLTYAMGTDGQKDLAPQSYPLSSDLITQTQAAIKKIPTTSGGGDGNGNGNGNGNGGGSGSGSGSGFGSGSGTGVPTTPPPSTPPPSSSPSPSPSPTIFIALGSHLSSPASSSAIPILAAIAILGLLIGPMILLVSRAAPRVVSATSNLGSRGTRAAGKGAQPSQGPETPDAPAGEGPPPASGP